MPFEFRRLEIPDVVLIKPKVFGDERGFFMETYKKSDFERAGIKGEFVQDNHSKSRYGVLRGLHYQKGPYTQAKIVRCIKGVIYDVAVDLRKNSPTFGKYIGVILSEYNKYMLYVPRGFAHGFLVLSGEAEVVYKVDNEYAPDYEGGLIWKDPDVNIPWPIEDPILSEKDQKWPTLRELMERDELF
ncbi:dTDP-4-dehydrorhamnose 3,5-epimerase [Methanothermococcus sp. SCGC AD-155-E23]|nr:dTDP-4-dehydrorhamnose 3,5-epimerase [Methanothermococcus sp. SCGC AD-155-E23]